ncbi:peptide ABC transporter substrate-binding protein [Solimonas marina]|uniref:Peptide ABC transporter substrate-binding protein n=1 Tax=Solimonas marina TaxID=2714601 RepID=A0A969WD11_9GAMM|nr:peptide ABC transporter substrate-binding protein [Solimonas marina]NKF24313.1 peptide ABC transporter substrate-binding protein [Solimonas marina]
MFSLHAPAGRRALLPALLLSLLAFAACGRHDDASLPQAAPAIKVGTQPAPDAEQVLSRQILGSPRTLDPSLSTGIPAQHVLDDLFEGLVTIDEAGHIAPGVATSWEISADGLTWTFHLRDDAQWSNGQPVTAQDFIYGWRRTVAPATASEYAQALAPIVNAYDISTGKKPVDQLGAEAPDPHTLVVHLVAPTPYFLELLTMAYLAPLYKPAIDQWGDAWIQAGHMISNGPFLLSESVINGHITLLKNPHYWDAANVRIQKVVYYPINDPSAATSRYLAGELDWTNRFVASDTERLTKALGDQVVHGPYFGTVMLGFNNAVPPFKDNPKLRRAMSMAIDRKIITRYIEHGIATPAYNMIPPLAGYTPAIPDWAKLSDDDRHALARKLYHEAGYSDKHPLNVVLTYPTSGPSVRRFMDAIAAMWRINLGANVQLYDVQWKVLLQRLQMKQPIFFWNAWIGDYPDPFTFMQLFQKGFAQNYGDYYDPKFEALLARAQASPDNAERYRLFHQAEQILNDDGAYIPFYYYPTTHLVKPYLKGWKDNVLDRNLSRYMVVLQHEGH